MASPSVSLLLVLAVLATSFAGAQLCRNNVTTFVFESFDCFKDRHLKCTGDCTSTADGKLNLTSYDMKSWGRIMYSPGIRLVDPVTTRVAYFSTNFTFSMKGDYSRPGEGLAFVMQANPLYQGHSGGFLGLYNKDGKAGTPTVAIEFDTYRDWFYGFFMYNDINSNHVGVDIESINSKIQADAGSVGIDLGKEKSVTAWIDYIPGSDNSDGNLQVRISTDTIRPIFPLLSYNVDLSKHMSEIMYLGFSATTGDHLVTSDCLSYHNILSWSFDSWGLGPHSPPPPILPPPPSVLPPNPPTPSPSPPSSPALPPLTPDAPSPSPSAFSPPAPAPFSSPSPSPSSSGASMPPSPSPSLLPPAPYPIFPPLPYSPPALPPNSPVPVPSPDTAIPPIPNLPASSPFLAPPPAISPSPADEPSLPPESIPSPTAGPAPSSRVSPPAPLPPSQASTPAPAAAPSSSTCVSPAPAPAFTPTPSPAPSPSAPSPNSTLSPSPAPAPTSLPAPAPSPASSPVPDPAPGHLDATRSMTASIAGFALLLSGYALVVYNRVVSELGDGMHSRSRVGYLGDQTMIGIWPNTR